MTSIRGLIREVHRRSLWQVTGIFLAASWGALQVIETITDTAGLPDWTPSMALVLLILGLPICLATAFVQEGMPGQDEEGPTDDDTADAPAENLAEGTGSLDRPTTRPTGTRRLLTWKNAILGGVGAFALLGFSLIAYFVMWSTGIGPVGNLVAQGVIEDGVRVVLADFEDDTGEGLGEVVTEALRVDLTEAQVLDLVDPAGLSATLSRMQIEPGAALTEDVALEVAVREGLGAVIEGGVAAVGDGYLITASLRDAGTGEAISTFRSSAADPSELIASIDKLSQDIRERSGESLREIKRGEPLEQVTTSSLEALRLYSEAERIFGVDDSRALELLEAAVEIDPEFAMAWRKLAAGYNNVTARRAEMPEAARRAFEHRDRLPERERYLAEATYFSQVESDNVRAAEAYRAVLEIEPDHPAALNNLANTYGSFGDREGAAEMFRRAIDGPGRTVTAMSNLVLMELSLGRLEAAADVVTRLEDAYPEAATNALSRFHVLLLGDAHSQAQDFAAARLSDPDRSSSERAEAAGWLAKIAYRQGRLADGRDYLRRAATIGAQTNAVLESDYLFNAAYYEALLGDPQATRTAIERVVASEGYETLGTGRTAVTAWSATIAGHHDLSRSILDGEYGPIDGEDAWVKRVEIIHRAAVGDTVGAIDEFETLREVVNCLGDQCWIMERAMVAELSGDLPRAIELYEQQSAAFGVAWPILGIDDVFATSRLAPLYERVGDTDAAIATYGRLIAMQQDADAEGQARVREWQARVDALSGADR